MRPHEIRGALRGQPFQPFRVRLSTGQGYEVRHPEFVALTRTNLFVGEPVEAEVLDINDARILVAWKLPGKRNEVGQFTHAFSYRLNLNPAQAEARITGKVEGYSNHENVKGDCERRK